MRVQVDVEQQSALVVRDPNGLMPQASAPIGGLTLTGDPTVNVATIGTLHLKEKQIKALRRPITDDEVEWKPTRKGGDPQIPYLSHNGYRDRIDAAFGLGGWGMGQVGMPKEKDGIVYVLFALIVNGDPRFYAWGEQEYHATKADGSESRHMTYGDALEGAKSSAITRCGKELGVARQLWNRRYIAGLKHRVPVKDRLIGDWPVHVSSGGDGSRRQEDARPPATASSGHEQEPISDGQRKRLFVIGKKAGRTHPEIKAYLKAFYGIESTKAIKRQDYEDVCNALEKRGPLPRKEPVREPDEVLPPVSSADLQWGLRNE